jgi:CheY-like chemotaxis protein
MLPTNPTHRLTVLLADESDAWALTVKKLLEPQGVQTIAAHTGREALRLIESGAIHVAVLDTVMPQMGGMQVVKRMRDLPDAPPAILLAEHLSNHLLQEALGLRVFSVLAKPVDFNQLLDSLARVMRRHYESRWPEG